MEHKSMFGGILANAPLDIGLCRIIVDKFARITVMHWRWIEQKPPHEWTMNIAYKLQCIKVALTFTNGFKWLQINAIVFYHYLFFSIKFQNLIWN